MKKLFVLLASCALLSCQSHVREDLPHKTGAGVDLSRDINRWPSTTFPAYSAEINLQAESLLAQMTLEEKVGQIMQAEIQALEPGDVTKYHLGSVLNGGGSIPYRKKGAPVSDWVKLADALYEESVSKVGGRVGIPVIWGTDAVHGHNNVTGATIFPHNMGLGAAGNPELVRKIGQATARAVRATGIDWVFAPTIAVAQNDLWGRTYESYSENPEVVAEYSKVMVEGLQGMPGAEGFVQGEQVLACAKHFVADGGTFEGDDQGDARIDERTLIDVHAAGYPSAINAGVQTVMASFSSWNGEKSHGHHYLLTEVLKNKLGFNGFVVGDWNGHGQVPGCSNESCAASINAGVDLIMVPYDWKAMYHNTLAQVLAGEISEERLNDAVLRILRVKLLAGLFDGKPSSRIPKDVADSIGSEAHRALARQAVRESLVLLKNNDNLLPLKPSLNVVVAGPGADSIPMQSGGWSITWQGLGTSNEDFPGATSIFAGIQQTVSAAGGRADLSENGEYTSKPDVAIVVFGEEPYAEGFGDRNSLEFEPGNKSSLTLLRKFQEKNIPVVSVFLSGRPMWVNPELNASDAFVAAWLPGSEGAGIADVLFTDKNGKERYGFSGRLSFSWPATPQQTEINWPDYSQAPLFELGYGLSYSDSKNLAQLKENIPGLAPDSSNEIVFFNGRTIQPWSVFIKNSQRNQILSGAFAALPDGDVKIQTTDKNVQEDSLRFTWSSTQSAGLFFLNGKPLDFSGFREKGGVTFDVNIKSLSDNATLTLEMMCGENCARKTSLSRFAKAHLNKGWQSVAVSLECFKGDETDFKKIDQPFNIEARESGELEFTNIRFLATIENPIPCEAVQP